MDDTEDVDEEETDDDDDVEDAEDVDDWDDVDENEDSSSEPVVDQLDILLLDTELDDEDTGSVRTSKQLL